MIAAVLLAVCSTACAGSPGTPFDARGSFEPPHASRVEVHALIQQEHRRDASRYVGGAVAALATMTPWVGPWPRPSITLVDPRWHAPASAGPSVSVLERTPWWSSATAMTPELAAARAVARAGWSGAVDLGNLPEWFSGGLVEYTARRAVTPLFQAQNLLPGYAMLEERYFGALVPRFVRVRLLPERDGEPVSSYRAWPVANPASPHSADEQRSLAGKMVLTLNTVERWVGRPVFDAVLAAFANQSRGRRPTPADFARVASASSGQDLSWLFDQVFGGPATFDYAVTDFTSMANDARGYDTRVVVSRLGDGMFTGASAPRVGPYESGRGVMLAVTFEDGEHAIDAWDGRDRQKTFVFRSPARAESAIVDPDQRMVLDVHRTNNSRSISARGGPAATRWAARWLLWLEHALLSYSALV